MLAGLLEAGMSLLGTTNVPYVVDEAEIVENGIVTSIITPEGGIKIVEFKLDEIVELISTEFEERFSRKGEKEWKRK